MSKVIAGVDIGGSGIKACLVGEDGRILARTALPTDLAHSEGVGDLALAALSKAAADAGYGLEEVESIGVGIPGQVSNGHVRYAANLGIGEAGLDLGGYVSSATQVPTLVDNDMTVAAYGAYVLTAAGGETVSNLVYVGLGTGVSAGVVLDGRVYRGSRGLAGEFGHVPMGTGIECACGSTSSTGWWTSLLSPLSSEWTFDNYSRVLGSGGLFDALINSLIVTIPSTIIPITLAAFAAFGFAWLKFRGRSLLFGVLVGLLVVPLQLSLVPLLQIYQSTELTGSFLGIWLAHTGFGLPLAVFLLYNFIS